MPKQKRQSIYVKQMLDAIAKIELYAPELHDEKTLYATERCFQILGEASIKLNDTVKASYPAIPWRDIKLTRNFITHQYDDIEIHEIKWMINTDLPTIKPCYCNYTTT